MTPGRSKHCSAVVVSLLLWSDGPYTLITYAQVKCSKVGRSNPQTTKCQHRSAVPWRVVAFIAYKWHISLYWVQMWNGVTSELKCWFLQRSNGQRFICQYESSMIRCTVSFITYKWRISLYCVQMCNRVISEAKCWFLQRSNGQGFICQFES